MATDEISLVQMHDLNRRVSTMEGHCAGCKDAFARIEVALTGLQSSVVNMKVRTALNAGAVGAIVGSGMVVFVVAIIWEVLKKG